MGARVSKTFKGVRHFGTVIDEDSDNITGNNIYGIEYDDGDKEDYDQEELSQRLDAEAPPAVNAEFAPEHMSDCVPCFVASMAKAVSDLAISHKVPKHMGEVRKSPDRLHWMSAVKAEIDALRSMGCYELINEADVPSGFRILGYTWVFKIKIHQDGTISRYKARVCVNGSQQRYGIDYTSSFAPVALATTIRLVLALATHYSLVLRQYDIKLAFVSAKIDRPVFMKAPFGSNEPRGSVWRLKRCLYGLVQSPRLFNAKLNSVLLRLGWSQSRHDPCLYHRRTGAKLALLIVVVDDLLLATSDVSLADDFRKAMSVEFDFKAMGEPSYMIGLHLKSGVSTLQISQRQYLTDLRTRFSEHLEPWTPTYSPAPGGSRLVSTGIAKATPSPPADLKLYRSLVGSLMYAVVSRPDVAAPVSMCARFLAAPTCAHLDAALRVLRYLLTTQSLALTYTRTPSPRLAAYVDSSWAGDPDTRRSRYGFAVYFGLALISWRSKLPACVSLSSAEAEYVGATEVCKEVMWLRHLLKEIGYAQSATAFYEDNAACVKMAENQLVSGRNKHMELKMHFIRERVEEGAVKLIQISTSVQRADLFTKNLCRPLFEFFRDDLLRPRTVQPIVPGLKGGVKV